MAEGDYILSVLSLIAVTGVSSHATGVGHNSHQCVYTFTVPRHGQDCPHGSEEEVQKIQEVKEIIQREHAQLNKKLDDISTWVNELKALVNETAEDGNAETSFRAGTHYTRWGASTCPPNTGLLYNGYAAKSHYTNGGGQNYQCLTSEPEFLPDVSGGYQSKSYIYGVEYEHQTSPVIPRSKHDNDVPCAVCHINKRGETLMIPAKRTCPSGWTKEYEGVLMSEHSEHSASEYICVDKELEVLPGGYTNQNGGLLYVVEAVCGALPCPPYVDGYEVSCVVCTL